MALLWIQTGMRPGPQRRPRPPPGPRPGGAVGRAARAPAWWSRPDGSDSGARRPRPAHVPARSTPHPHPGAAAGGARAAALTPQPGAGLLRALAVLGPHAAAQERPVPSREVSGRPQLLAQALERLLGPVRRARVVAGSRRARARQQQQQEQRQQRAQTGHGSRERRAGRGMGGAAGTEAQARGPSAPRGRPQAPPTAGARFRPRAVLGTLRSPRRGSQASERSPSATRRVPSAAPAPVRGQPGRTPVSALAAAQPRAGSPRVPGSPSRVSWVERGTGGRGGTPARLLCRGK